MASTGWRFVSAPWFHWCGLGASHRFHEHRFWINPLGKNHSATFFAWACWGLMLFFCFSAGIKLTYIQFMKIDFESKVCSESKLQLKSIHNVMFHLLQIFQHFQTMCSCGSCHTLLIFQLRNFLFKKIFRPSCGGYITLPKHLSREGGCFIGFKKRPYKEALFIKIAGFFSSYF